jgi:hypothetical protein
MKGQACSWRDMRKIRHILANADRLKGEYDALMRCTTKQMRTHWRRALEVMETLNGTDICTLTPSHATEIARLAPRETWSAWVERCERQQLTVAQLRVALRPRSAITGDVQPTTNERQRRRELAQRMIEQGYRALTLKHHPDHRGGSADSMVRLTAVRDALLHNLKRWIG